MSEPYIPPLWADSIKQMSLVERKEKLDIIDTIRGYCADLDYHFECFQYWNYEDELMELKECLEGRELVSDSDYNHFSKM